MHKILRLATLIIGSVLLINGLLKVNNLINGIELFSENLTYRVEPITWMPIVISIDFIGGILMILIAFVTWDFYNTRKELKLLDNDNSIDDIKGLSFLVQLAAIYIIIVSLWHLVMLLINIPPLLEFVTSNFLFILLIFLFYASFAIFPLLYVFKILSFNNKINSELKRRRLIDILSKRNELT